MRRIKGFTLIELLVVISLIGVLATLVFANLNAARQRGRDAQRKSDLRNIQTALRLYYNDYGKYPQSSGSDEIMGCGSNGISTCAWGSPFAAGSQTYMNALPNDPQSANDSIYQYQYEYVDSDTYKIKALLENESDSAIAESQSRCGGGGGGMEAYVCLSNGSSCQLVSNCLYGCYLPPNESVKATCDSDCNGGTATIATLDSLSTEYIVCP